jgi:DNA/RNA endonuclease G (NUC1)
VSWHLSDEWFGTLARVDTFRADPAVPADWYRVTHVDYTNSGFDRGHMTPNADRDPETSSPINQATFLMSNMVPQAPDNNQGPWANMENYLRTLLPANELYIVAGGAGTGGTGSNGGVTNTIANGHVSVPAATWKVALVIPKAGGDDVSRVGCGARTIAVVMPNVQGIRNNDWQGYITTVDAVETLTGYDFFSNLPDAVETCVEAGTNGVNPPGAEDSAYTTAEDTPANVSMTALPSGPGALTYTVVSAPSHGTLAGTGADRTYTPAADFHGADSFTFNVSDGTRTSRTATVSLLVTEVNDAPAAVADEATTDEDTPVSVNVVSNDTDADGNALSLGGVSGATHGSVAVVDGQAVFTPDADYNGPASFDYVVGDGQGGTATGSVSVTVKAVNDAPTANADSFATDEDAAVTVNVRANDTDVEGDTLAVTAVGTPSHGTATLVAGNGVRYTPAANYNGPDSFTYTVSDGNGGTATGTVNMSVAAANDAPVLSGVPASANVNELAAYTFTAQAGDVDGDGLTFSLVGAPAGAGISQAGVFNWTPTEAQGGTGSPYSFTVRVTDGTVNTDSPVTITVNEVNQAPSLAHVGDRVVTLGGTLAFTASGSDADLPAQGLSYGLTGSVPAGASINPTTGAFNWTPTAAQAGHVYAFGVRVTDSGGLFAEEIINVGVGHSWSGFLQPVEADGSSVFKLGRTVPVKFQLTGASAGITDAVARLYVAKVTGNVVGPEQAAVSASNATEGNLFRQTGNHYMFNLSTDGLTAGTYQLRVDMGDGVQRTVLVSFR